MVRAILDSLALRTAQTARDLAAIAGRSPSRIVVVGGGASNQLLNRLLAATAGLPVWTAPTEATALGNAVVQRAAAVGVGDVAGLRTQLPPAVEAASPDDLPEVLERATEAASRLSH